MGKKGGKQVGGGRPKGSPNKSTLEQRKVLEAFNQRVMGKADALFNAQYTLAVGSMRVFRVDETQDGNKTKREHVHVTDADEIKALLDEHDGSPGVVEGVYYYFSDVSPDNKAIEAMLNRALGKAVEKLETSGSLKIENVSMQKAAEMMVSAFKKAGIDLDLDQALNTMAQSFQRGGIDSAEQVT